MQLIKAKIPEDVRFVEGWDFIVTQNYILSVFLLTGICMNKSTYLNESGIQRVNIVKIMLNDLPSPVA